MTNEEYAISSLIIDGYNLIGIYHEDLNAAREGLIERLIEYGKQKGHDIIVVFDGWKGGAGQEISSVREGLKIIYSRLGERADLVIKRIISSDRREWIVISSDREIASEAWATGSIPVPSEAFLPFLEGEKRSNVGSSRAEKDEGEGEPKGCRKGNPKQLSRKEKAVMRVLGKL